MAFPAALIIQDRSHITTLIHSPFEYAAYVQFFSQSMDLVPVRILFPYDALFRSRSLLPVDHFTGTGDVIAPDQTGETAALGILDHKRIFRIILNGRTFRA